MAAKEQNSFVHHSARQLARGHEPCSQRLTYGRWSRIVRRFCLPCTNFSKSRRTRRKSLRNVHGVVSADDVSEHVNLSNNSAISVRCHFSFASILTKFAIAGGAPIMSIWPFNVMLSATVPHKRVCFARKSVTPEKSDTSHVAPLSFVSGSIMIYDTGKLLYKYTVRTETKTREV